MVSNHQLRCFYSILSVKQLAGGVVKQKQLKGLILAQNERWRRGLGMQVERQQARKGAGERRKGE